MSRSAGVYFAILAFFLLVYICRDLYHYKETTMSEKKSVRLVILSDTHRSYTRPIPVGDVLIHCGDSELSKNELDAWAADLSHRAKLSVAGNMDIALSDERKDRKSSFQHVTYLQDNEQVVSGIKFYGSPWTPEFVGVFQLRNSADAQKVWNKVPSDADVLITHGPPAGVLDRTSRGMGVGDRDLLDLVRNVRPRVHCFGHVHESYGTLRENGTLFCNAAVFNGHPAIVVDLPLDKNKPAILVNDEASHS